MNVMVRAHLGGYVEGGDDATYYPDLWRWLVREHGVRSVLDVGCGEGHALRYFQSIGAAARGVEGIPQAEKSITTHDYTLGPFDHQVAAQKGMALFGNTFEDLDYDFDLVWCCEFVEHVEEVFVPNFLTSFSMGKMVLMTHAEPGQAGYHHVNCRRSDYWVGVLAAIGYQLDPYFTQAARVEAQKNTNPYNHFARSGLAFRKSR